MFTSDFPKGLTKYAVHLGCVSFVIDKFIRYILRTWGCSLSVALPFSQSQRRALEGVVSLGKELHL